MLPPAVGLCLGHSLDHCSPADLSPSRQCALLQEHSDIPSRATGNNGGSGTGGSTGKQDAASDCSDRSTAVPPHGGSETPEQEDICDDEVAMRAQQLWRELRGARGTQRTATSPKKKPAAGSSVNVPPWPHRNSRGSARGAIARPPAAVAAAAAAATQPSPPPLLAHSMALAAQAPNVVPPLSALIPPPSTPPQEAELRDDEVALRAVQAWHELRGPGAKTKQPTAPAMPALPTTVPAPSRAAPAPLDLSLRCLPPPFMPTFPPPLPPPVPPYLAAATALPSPGFGPFPLHPAAAPAMPLGGAFGFGPRPDVEFGGKPTGISLYQHVLERDEGHTEDEFPISARKQGKFETPMYVHLPQGSRQSQNRRRRS